MPVLVHDNKRFLFQCEFAERHLAKEAGFHWDDTVKKWYTSELKTAACLREYARGEAKSKIDSAFITRSPWTKPLSRVPINLSLFPHQVEAINYALSQNRCYLGLDPGLGKTIVAAIVCAELKVPCVYICPPFLLQNVEAEFNKWAPELRICIYSSKKNMHTMYPTATCNVTLVPDSLLTRAETLDHIHLFLGGSHEAILIVDEAHRFKNPEAKRTQALLGKGKVSGIADQFVRHIYMSGTPMPNRPIELYAILAKAAPECINFMSEFQYGRRYCAGWSSPWGWDFSGASNIAELAAKVIAPRGKFMLRQKKALLNLPPKLEEVFVVSAGMSPRLSEMNAKLGEAYRDVEDLIKIKLAAKVGTDEEDLHVATYRRLLGVEKATHAVPYIESLLTETDESILVFAYHKDVITKLTEGLAAYKPIVITGATPVGERQDLVAEFQKESGPRILIGNYVACGVGFTLTKATRVIFAEFDWVPGVNAQASDRAHRIGQTEPVLVQYVAYKDSIDKAVIETLLRKQRTFNLKG